MTQSKTRILATLGVLVAMEVVLNRFLSINAWNIKIGFSFVPVAIGAMLYGPLGGGAVGALGDFLGAILFPIGAYFPGFTLTSFLMGAVLGTFLHQNQTLPRTAAAVGINQFILGLLLNSFWISLLYGVPYLPLLSTRIVQSILLTVVQLIVIPLLSSIRQRDGESSR